MGSTSGSLYDLTGNNIQDTYGRLVQAVPIASGANDPRTTTTFYDGYGNIIESFNSTASFAVSASYAISASHEIVKEVSSSYADTASYVNPLNQDVIINGDLNVTGSFTASGLNYPVVDGERGDVLTTDGAGTLTFDRTRIYAQIKNVSGGTLFKGTPVHVSSSVGNLDEVVAASASVASTMPATFILAEDLADDEEGLGILTGFINGVNTSAFGEGDIVYVAPNGGYTNVKPTGSNLIQNLGIVTRVAINGSGFIYGSGRSNDTPNLLTGNVFYGVGDRAVQVPLSDIVSGSLFSYSGSFSGSFEGDGSGLTGVVSSSYAETASYALNSELLDGRDSTTFTSTSSFNSFTSSYYTDSASFETNISNNSSSIATLSSSYLDSSASFAADILTNSASISQLSGSYVTFTSSYYTDSGSISTRLTANESDISNLQTDSASFSTRVTTNESDISGLQTDSASFSTRITNNSSSISTLSSSYLDSSASFASDILTNSASISTLSGSFISFSASYSTGSFTGSFTGSAEFVDVTASSAEVTNEIKSGIFLNKQILTIDQTVPTTYNGMLISPISVSESVNLSVSGDSTLVII